MKNTRNNLKFTWKFIRFQKWNIIGYILCNILHVIVSVITPILSAKIIVELTNNVLIQVLQIAIVLFLTECIRNFIHYVTNYLSQKIYRESFIVIQSELGKEILRLDNKTLDENSSGVFIQRLTNDTSNLADIYNVFNIYLTKIVTNIGIFGAVFIINKKMFLFLLIMVSIIFMIERRRTSIVNEKDKAFREEQENVTGFVGELIRGSRDIKMLGAEQNFMDELHNKVVDLNQTRYRMMSSNRNYMMIRGVFYNLFDVTSIFLLVYLIFTNELTIASALVIHNYMNRITSLADAVGILMEKLKSFNLSATRIFNIMESDEFTKETFGTKHLDKVQGYFEFKDVNFSYKEGQEVLKKLNFKIKPKETVAFVGKSGAGKSTIFSLLCKMYNVKDGSIKIDDINIEELDKESIRNNITIISQNPYLFNISIKDNLRLVKKDVSDEEIEKACKLACLDDLINVLPDKYDTIVGEGGITLSGGQRQRLAIARALIQNTEIILFDEATSSLDNETQKKIQEAINNLKDNYTILIIAHRLSTIINCDRILFLNNGKIEQEGTHEELMKNCIEYKNLYEAEMRN